MELVGSTAKMIEESDFEPVTDELCSSNECEAEMAEISSAESVEAEPDIPVLKPNPGRRAVNIVASLILLAIASPIMLLIAFLIKATSPGPVVYSQPRVGLDRRGQPRRQNGRKGTDGRRDSDTGGRLFTIYKFRTMTLDNTASAQVWATPEDPRITRVGHFLRRYRLDELPQLFNVLRGEMNLVGPRPEQPVIFEDLRGKIDAYQQRQKVLPGITGWAQVNNAYDQSLDDVKRKVDLDLEYIESASVAQDLKIMAKTLPVMVFKKGSV